LFEDVGLDEVQIPRFAAKDDFIAAVVCRDSSNVIFGDTWLHLEERDFAPDCTRIPKRPSAGARDDSMVHRGLG
jgi:hypothetical protein